MSDWNLLLCSLPLPPLLRLLAQYLIVQRKYVNQWMISIAGRVFSANLFAWICGANAQICAQNGLRQYRKCAHLHANRFAVSSANLFAWNCGANVQICAQTGLRATRKMRNSAGIASNFDEQRNLRASKNSLELKTLVFILLHVVRGF